MQIVAKATKQETIEALNLMYIRRSAQNLMQYNVYENKTHNLIAEGLSFDEASTKVQAWNHFVEQSKENLELA